MSRNVTITITGAHPIDAHKAIVKRIEETELKYERDPSSVTDLASVSTVVTGTTPFKVYAFTLTSTMATGTYSATFVEEAPNVESLTPES